jgi:hypothetical protein
MEASRSLMISRAALKISVCFAALLWLGVPGVAHAQSIIKQPGNHANYSVEIEPHLAFQWADRIGYNSGFGAGARFNIPFVHNGPISSINNAMGITFGMDLTFGNGGPGWCYGAFDRNQWRDDCSVTEFWLPVAMQWNFYLTKVISVFGEPGLAIVHRRWSYDPYCAGNNGPYCARSYSTNDVEPIFAAGGRFMFSDKIGATVRIGVPMITAGINFLL